MQLATEHTLGSSQLPQGEGSPPPSSSIGPAPPSPPRNTVTELVQAASPTAANNTINPRRMQST
jgi:hypothetical protein